MRRALVVGGVILLVALVTWRMMREPDHPARAPAPAAAVDARARDASEGAELGAPISHPARALPVLRRPVSPQPADSTPIEIQRDPSHPDYDAAKLFGATGGNAIEFWKHEPRDEVWATEHERIISDQALPALRKLDKDAKIHAECRTGVCRVRVYSHNDSRSPLTCLSNMISTTVKEIEFSPEDPAIVGPYEDVYLFFGEETHDNDATAESERCAKARAKFLERATGSDRARWP